MTGRWVTVVPDSGDGSGAIQQLRNASGAGRSWGMEGTVVGWDYHSRRASQDTVETKRYF